MSVVVAWEEGMYSCLDWGLVQGVGGGCGWLGGRVDDDGDRGWWWCEGEERAWGVVGGGGLGGGLELRL